MDKEKVNTLILLAAKMAFQQMALKVDAAADAVDIMAEVSSLDARYMALMCAVSRLPKEEVPGWIDDHLLLLKKEALRCYEATTKLAKEATNESSIPISPVQFSNN